MKKITILASAAAFMLSLTTVAQGAYTMDKAHASVGFTITHLSISDIDLSQIHISEPTRPMKE
ncbi:MAG: hypothetical protein ACHQII_08070, partial [Bacteroidia bacterium]